jgi:hypothetical protein
MPCYDVRMHKLSLKTVAFLQAAGIVVYVLLFAFVVQTLGRHFEPMPVSPFLSMALALMAFVFSASVCATIFLGHPAYLFFDGKKKEAVRLVLWSIIWLAAFVAILLVLLPFSASR